MTYYEDLPGRVERVRGAAHAPYPWEDAPATISALRDMADKLTEHFETRANTLDNLEDWEGPYRDEFDKTYGRLESRTVGRFGITESLRNAAQRIVDGAHDANADQRRRNNYAESIPEEDRKRRESHFKAGLPSDVWSY